MNGPECRKMVRGSLRRWGEVMPRRLDRHVGDIRGKFRRFAKEAKQDLEFLCEKGANPFILIWIVDTHLWWWSGAHTERERERESDAGYRRLSSPVYWIRCAKALERTVNLLSILKSNMRVQIMARLNADGSGGGLIRVSRLALQADSATRDLLHAIQALELNKPGWELIRASERDLPTIVRTGKRGKRLSGRSRAADWGACAAVLHEYLILSTGRAHWVTIVRLLRSAGVDCFKAEIPREGEHRALEDQGGGGVAWEAVYTDTVRKRIARLRRDPVLWPRSERLAREYNTMFGRDDMVPPPG